MPSPPPYAAQWQAADGDWFSAGNWLEADPETNAPLHYVPNANNAVTLANASPFTVTYDGVDEVWSLGGNSVTLNIAGGSLTVDHDSVLTGAINLASGATLAAAAGAALTFWGGAIAGALGGGGTIQFQYGNFSLNPGTVLSVANLILGVSGNGTVSTTTLNADLAYGGNFTQVDYSGNQALLLLDGHTLTLTGPATLDGTISGPGKVVVSGQVTEPTGYGGNTIVGGALLEAASGATITQHGNVFLGDSTSKGTLRIDAGATYRIATIGTINSGGDSLLVNDGLLVDEAAGPNWSWINGGFTNNGQLTIDAGATLDFAFPGAGVETFGGTIDGGGTLSFSNGAKALINTNAVSVANWNISDGTTKLGVDLTYGGVFDFNAPFGVLDLGGHTLTLTGASDHLADPYGNIIGGGLLKVAGAATLGALTVGYNGAPAVTIEDAGSISQTSGVTLNGTLLIDAGATYEISQASAITTTGASGATTINNGTLVDGASGVSEIQGSFTNNGALKIASGATLGFSGVQTFGGSIEGAGTLALGFGAQATIDTADVTVANIYINGGNGGGTTKLGVDLNYGGNFNFANQFGTLDLAGHTLTLSGISSLSGANVAGPGVVKVTGSATLGYLAVGYNGAAAATIEDAGSITQNNPLTLNGALLIDAGATYTIANAPYGEGISKGGGSATITNNGSFVDEAPGLAGVDAAFVNNGTITAAAGATLDIHGAVTGTGSAVIRDDGGLKLRSAFGENVAFEGREGGRLSLAQAYAGTVSGLWAGDEIDFGFVNYAAGERLVRQSAQIWAIEDAGHDVLATLNVSGLPDGIGLSLSNDGFGHALATAVAPRNDFLGLAKSSLLIENTAGAVVVATVGGDGQAGYTQIGALGSEWAFVGNGDFIGDGTSNTLIFNESGAVVVGDVQNGQLHYTQVGALGSEWKFVATGDFIADGTSNTLIFNESGAVVLGDVQNGQLHYTQVGALGSEWEFVATGDFFGDGLADTIIENKNGAVVVAEVENGELHYTQVGGLGLEWTFVGAGDFLGAGHDQFLIENKSGAVVVGDVQNGQAQYTQVGGLGLEWDFIGTGDYYGIGKVGFAIENNAGAVYVGTIAGGQASYTQIGALGKEWTSYS